MVCTALSSDGDSHHHHSEGGNDTPSVPTTAVDGHQSPAHGPPIVKDTGDGLPQPTGASIISHLIIDCSH